jgi:hypothetical protein
MHSPKRMHRAREAIPSRDRLSTRPSLGPLTRAPSIATATSSGQPGGGGALESISRSGKTGESQEEPAPGSKRVEDVRLAAGHRFRKEEGVTRQNRKGVTALVPARIVRARVKCPFVVAVAEIGRRRPTPNKLVKRAPKRAVRGE